MTNTSYIDRREAIQRELAAKKEAKGFCISALGRCLFGLDECPEQSELEGGNTSTKQKVESASEKVEQDCNPERKNGKRAKQQKPETRGRRAARARVEGGSKRGEEEEEQEQEEHQREWAGEESGTLSQTTRRLLFILIYSYSDGPHTLSNT
jgi:hypothetical protein